MENIDGIVGYIEDNFGRKDVEEYLAGLENGIFTFLEEKGMDMNNIDTIKNVLEFNSNDDNRKAVSEFYQFLHSNK